MVNANFILLLFWATEDEFTSEDVFKLYYDKAEGMIEKQSYRGSHLASLDTMGGAVERFDRDISNYVARYIGKLESLDKAPSTKRLQTETSKHTREL